MEDNIQTKKLSKEIGSISDGVISLTASLAMGILLTAPAIMAVMAMFKQSIDFTMYMYLSMIKNLVFPLACSIVLIIYLILITRYQTAGVSIKRIVLKNPVFLIFSIASLLILISQFYNGMQYALTGFCSQSLGETFGMEICYFVFILFGATQVKEESHKKWLLRIHIIASYILVLAAFILWHTQTESLTFFSDWTPRFSSIFSNTNYYGYYLTVSVALAGAAFIYEKKLVWKVTAGVAFILNTVALSLNDTMGAWIGGIFAVLFIVIAHVIIEKKVNWQALALIPVFALSLYIPGHITGTFESNFSTLTGDMANIMEGNEEAENAGSARWKIWKASLDIAKENKFMGIGFEGVKQRQYVGAPYNIRPHNEFLQYAMFHGFPMAIMYFAGCLGVFIRALRKKKQMNGATLVSLAAAFGYLVSSFFGLTIFATGYFLFVFLGMGYVSGDPENTPKTEEAKDNRKSNIMICGITVAVVVILSIICGLKGLADFDTGSQTSGNEPASGNQPVIQPTDQNVNDDNLPVVTLDNITYVISSEFAIVSSAEINNSVKDAITIPDKINYEGKEYIVIAIDDSAFDSLSELKEVILPDTIKIIGSYAFYQCESLKTINLPNSLEDLGDEVFSGCTSLKSIELPASIKEIGTELFYGCTSLTSVTLPEGMTEVPAGTFSGCSKLTTVKIPSTVTSLGSEMFLDCESIKEIILPENLTTIGDNAFSGCTSIKEIRLPASIKSIGGSVFDNCDKLKTVLVPNDSIKIYKDMFEEYDFKVQGY